MNILNNLFRRKPKADLGLTDNIAIEVLRAYLQEHCGENVCFARMHLWTSDQVYEHNEVRTIKINVRPVTQSEHSVDGLYPEDALPEVEAQVSFLRPKFLFCDWECYMLVVEGRRWSRHNFSKITDPERAPYLATLVQRLIS